jgi:hypothetical protein
MKKYTVGMVRERFAQALDEAARGEPVFIERKGVTYRLSVEPPARAARARQPTIDVLDPAIDAGEWAWEAAGGELRFKDRTSGRKR